MLVESARVGHAAYGGVMVAFDSGPFSVSTRKVYVPGSVMFIATHPECGSMVFVRVLVVALPVTVTATS
ncbi:MAG: hypothetical protein ABEH78_09760 [Haloferacaceae archaeon]